MNLRIARGFATLLISNYRIRFWSTRLDERPYPLNCVDRHGLLTEWAVRVGHGKLYQLENQEHKLSKLLKGTELYPSAKFTGNTKKLTSSLTICELVVIIKDTKKDYLDHLCVKMPFFVPI